MGDRGIGERRAKLGVNIVDAEFLRNLGKIGRPFDAAGLLELCFAAALPAPTLSRVSLALDSRAVVTSR